MSIEKPLLKFVLVALADSCDKTGHCWLSYSSLASKCSLSRRYIISAVQELEEKGLILKKNRLHKNKRHTSNLYRILPNFIPKVNNSGAPGALGVVHGVH